MIHAFGRWGELRIGPRWGWVRTLRIRKRSNVSGLEPWVLLTSLPAEDVATMRASWEAQFGEHVGRPVVLGPSPSRYIK